MRDEFDAKTKDTLARRVGMRCSNPACRRLTCGPRAGPDGSINIGVAAHITAAASNGPRYNASIDINERTSPANGIWLCQVCAKLIDSDKAHYEVAKLNDWKTFAEQAAKQEMLCVDINGKRISAPELAFVTHMVEESQGGFRVQFGISNASPTGQLEVFHITPVLIFQHNFVRYLRVDPYHLPDVTIADLQMLQDLNRSTLLQSGDGVFGCSNLIEGKTYRLAPHEMETFSCQFVTVNDELAVWTIGFVVKFTDSTGNRRLRPSDSVFSINTKSFFSLAQYDLAKIEQRLATDDEYQFYDDTTVGFRGVFQRRKREPTPPDPDGVVRIKVDPRNVKPIVQGIPCDWQEMLSKSREFLLLQNKPYREMEPT